MALMNKVKSGSDSKLKLEPYQVILKPSVTEKALYQATELNQYTFQVNRAATKDEVKAAVEKLYGVKVTGVSTQNCKGKERRYRFRLGRTKDWKKAIVTLDKEDRVDFY